MNNKEKFVLFVYLGAIARDLTQSTQDSQQIAHVAARIPEKRIPLNALNAAQVYLAYLDGRSAPFHWMLGECGRTATRRWARADSARE